MLILDKGSGKMYPKSVRKGVSNSNSLEGRVNSGRYSVGDCVLILAYYYTVYSVVAEVDYSELRRGLMIQQS